MAGFIERYSLWTDEQKASAERIKATIQEKNLLLIRTAWEDQHGIMRSKSLLPGAFFSALENGMQISTGTYIFDTANALVYNPFIPGGSFDMPAMTGAPNLVLAPDPTTFKVVPWAERTAYILCDQYFKDGTPMPLSSRTILRRALSVLHQQGLEYVAGLEVEWHLSKLENPMLEISHMGAPGSPAEPPQVSSVEHGYQYLQESFHPEVQALLLQIAENLVAMELPLRSMENEWSPGQYEFTFEPMSGTAAADAMLLFRVAVKQICRLNGYHASFMCRPSLKGCYSNGWHLHQSLTERDTGKNAFAAAEPAALMSDLCKHFIGGLLAHAGAASIFAVPTINGYKRFAANSLAPDRANWGYDNRGAMIRLQGGFGDPTTHIENRLGEPAANPYLYMASQIIAGLDGIERQLDPGAPTEEPYAAQTQMLPKSLMDAAELLKRDTLYRNSMGDVFINFILTMKESETKRFLESMGGCPPQDYLEKVTDWEHREYFALF
ncbi:MAG: glutamine synthetase family protein [Cyanobacteria bacterium P01_D01_bin.1]